MDMECSNKDAIATFTVCPDKSGQNIVELLWKMKNSTILNFTDSKIAVEIKSLKWYHNKEITLNRKILQ